MTTNQLSARLAIATAVDLHRVAEGQIVALMELLRQLEADIVAAIIRRGSLTLESLLAETNELIRAAFAKLAEQIEADTDELIEAVAERERRNWLLLFGVPVEGPLELPTAATMLVAGATVKSWLAKQSADLSFRIGATTRTAFAGGTPDLNALADRVQGRLPDQPVPTVAQTERAVQTTVKTTAETVGTVVRQKVAEAAGESAGDDAKPPTVIRYGWQQISILDNRTTTVCRAYAYKRWNSSYEPLGHALPYAGGPPRHPNCRSVVILILLDEDALNDLTFAEWMATIKPAEQDSIFGAGMMNLWRAGKITDSDLINQQSRSLTLAQFADKNGQ